MKEVHSDAAKYDPQMRVLAGTDIPHRWYDPTEDPFRLAGFPWFDRDGVYRRMPVEPAEMLPEAVDGLANCTAGGQVAFQSNSPRVAVRVTLDGVADMVHMAATGQCGFDAYHGSPGAMRFGGASKYDHSRNHYELLLLERAESPMCSFVLNFPLYRGVKNVQIGLAEDAEILAPFPYATDGPIVVYGTSITQGGCASRPGMAYTNILSRALNVEVINLGFSGNGRGEPHVVRTVAAIAAPSLLVLDYESNAAGFDYYSGTLHENIRILRDRHPNTPILLISRIAYARDLTSIAGCAERDRFRAMQAELIGAHRDVGDSNLHFVDGTTLLGEDSDECTVDGVHPTDLGFMRMARALEPTIRRILDL